MQYQVYTHIVADPDVLSGKPVIEGTQVLASTLIEQIAQGKTLDEVARKNGVTVDDVRAALEYAAQRAGEPAAAAKRNGDTASEASRAPVNSRAVEEEARRLGLDPSRLSPLGRHLVELRVQGITSGEQLLSSWDELDAEIAERRGTRYPDGD